jgi:hypothetical protein
VGRLPRRVGVAAAALVAIVAVASALLVSSRDDGDVVVVDDGGPSRRPTRPSIGTVETVDATAVNYNLLVFGEQGISWIVRGKRHTIWSQPVAQAFPDGAGGVVFQELREPRSINWLRAGAADHLVMDDEPDDAHLRGVADLNGTATALLTRRIGDGEDQTETLYGYELSTVTEAAITDTGGSQSGLDAVAATAGGELLLSTCHLQCAVWPLSSREEEAGEPLVAPDWISGLDTEGDTLAYVRFTFDSERGTVTDPVLVVAGVDGRVRQQVPLEGALEGEQTATVDLSPDGRSAVVWFGPSAADLARAPIFIDDLGLEQAEPRIRTFAVTEGVRFASAVPDMYERAELDAAMDVVVDFLQALRRGDLDTAGHLVGEYVVPSDQGEAARRAMLEQFRDEFDWLIAAPSLEWYQTRSFGWTPASELPVITAVGPPSADGQRRAAAFLVTSCCPITDTDLQIERLPGTATGVAPPEASAVRPGDRIVFDGMSVEGGARAYINGREVTVEQDHETFRTTVEVPSWALEEADIVLTLSFSTPELPVPLALWYRIAR